WSDGVWEPLGEGLHATPNASQVVYAMAVFDDGSGPALFVGGEFDQAGGAPAGCVARWDGHAGSNLDGGGTRVTAPIVRSLPPLDDGSGPALFVGGAFTQAGSVPVQHVARWRGAAGWDTAGSAMLGAPFFVFAPFDDHSGSGPALFAGSHRVAGSITPFQS